MYDLSVLSLSIVRLINSLRRHILPPIKGTTPAPTTKSPKLILALGANRLSQWPSRRDRLCIHSRSTPLPRSGRPLQTHIPLHKYTWRLCHGRPRYLRHNDLHRLPRNNYLRGSSSLYGLPATLWRHAGETLRSTTFEHYGTSAQRRLFRSG